jgi:hypothetical protein
MAPRSDRARRRRTIAWRITLAGLAVGVICQSVPMAAPRRSAAAAAATAAPIAGTLDAAIAWELDTLIVWELDAPASP